MLGPLQDTNRLKLRIATISNLCYQISGVRLICWHGDKRNHSTPVNLCVQNSYFLITMLAMKPGETKEPYQASLMRPDLSAKVVTEISNTIGHIYIEKVLRVVVDVSKPELFTGFSMS
ncbi:MAG: hypothetical protein K8F91_09365 [Candidatus Obscuribacterales bacterium]|nr:hypothetical protein [Candidatus Obscuribacterales bacterium]